MQFVITCPVDGPIEVTVEDIGTVVLREPEEAEVVFTCPECGSDISMIVRIPSFLMAAIQAMATDTDSYVAPLASLVAMAAEADAANRGRATSVGSAIVEVGDDERIDAYCEYFRRQLSQVIDVEDALKELDIPSE